jgi:phage FluMu protein Com
MASDAGALDVLRCTQCDAPLALADTDTVKCPSCGTVNDIPASYRELHHHRIADTAARARAEKVLRSLDAPASMPVKVLARIFDHNMFVFMLLFGVPLTLRAVMLGMHAEAWYAKHFHYASVDDVPYWVLFASILVTMLVFAFVPRALGVYANRRVADRQRLLAALAAKPPKVPGAASQCRICGAPLAVEPDKILAVCSYCRAENAVHLETTLVKQAHDVAHAIGHEVSDAVKVDRAERSAMRRKLLHELARYVGRTVVLGTGFILGGQEDADHHSTTLGIIAIVATTLLFMYFIFRSLMTGDEDAAERRAANDVPGWVGVVGVIVFLKFIYWLPYY